MVKQAQSFSLVIHSLTKYILCAQIEGSLANHSVHIIMLPLSSEAVSYVALSSILIEHNFYAAKSRLQKYCKYIDTRVKLPS